MSDEEVVKILKEEDKKIKLPGPSVKFINKSPQDLIEETGVTKVDEVNESQEEDKEIGDVPDQNQLIQNFGFLFEEISNKKKSSFKKMKTKQQYREAFDKLEMRKVERTNVNSVKKNPQKKYMPNEMIEEKLEESSSKKD